MTDAAVLVPAPRVGLRGIICAHPSSLWQAIRAAYEGRDPARQARQDIAVEERAKQRQWRRPSWYDPRTLGKRRPKRAEAQVRRDRALALFRVAASTGAPCPNEAAICAALSVSARTAREIVTQLTDGKAFVMERRQGNLGRRAVFADGSATAWSGVKKAGWLKNVTAPTGLVKPEEKQRLTRRRRTVPDLEVRDAVRALQRRRAVVFDIGIHTGTWSERWCIDGKMVDRAGLLKEARA